VRGGKCGAAGTADASSASAGLNAGVNAAAAR